jgi:uncharacterized protein (DUF1499 family)
MRNVVLCSGFLTTSSCGFRLNDNTIAVRSAARTGYYDFGVNRRRVEKLRKQLRAN